MLVAYLLWRVAFNVDVAVPASKYSFFMLHRLVTEHHTTAPGTTGSSSDTTLRHATVSCKPEPAATSVKDGCQVHWSS